MKRTALTLGCIFFAASTTFLGAAPPEAPMPMPGAAVTTPTPTSKGDEPTLPAATGTSGAPVVDSTQKLKIRQREGAKVSDRRGRFERRGERYIFLAEEGGSHYVVIENLMLERVANMLDDAAGGELLWSVSGTMTEFRGSNFLILQRAVVKASGAPQPPRKLDDPLARQPAEASTAR